MEESEKMKIEEDGKTYILDGEKYNIITENISEFIDTDGKLKTVVTKYVKLSMYEKNKESILKYIKENKESINEYGREKFKSKYENDPEFREKEKKRARERYLKKKMEQTN